MLKTLNFQQAAQITSLTTSKKRKRVNKKSDSNAKLISIQDILDTPELQNLKEAENKAIKE